MSVIYYKVHMVLKKPTTNNRRFKNLCPTASSTKPCQWKNKPFYKICTSCKKCKFKNIFASIFCKKSSFKNIDYHLNEYTVEKV